MPKFHLSSTINTPQNMESCIITLQATAVLDDERNKFDRIYFEYIGVMMDNPQNYWGGFDLNLTQGRAEETTFAQTNMQTINSFLKVAEYLDLHNTEILVYFLYGFVLLSRCFNCFPFLQGDTAVAGHVK